jgi:hypothetical protein
VEEEQMRIMQVPLSLPFLLSVLILTLTLSSIFLSSKRLICLSIRTLQGFLTLSLRAGARGGEPGSARAPRQGLGSPLFLPPFLPLLLTWDPRSILLPLPVFTITIIIITIITIITIVIIIIIIIIIITQAQEQAKLWQQRVSGVLKQSARHQLNSTVSQ